MMLWIRRFVRRRSHFGERGGDQVDLSPDCFDLDVHLGRCRRGLVGQLLDFVGDDGEAASCLAGAGGFDRGVERKEIGLRGDAVMTLLISALDSRRLATCPCRHCSDRSARGRKVQVCLAS